MSVENPTDEELKKLEDDKKRLEEEEAKRKLENPDDKALVDKIVAEKVAEAIKDIKTKLDSAYSARDEAVRKATEFEKKEREEQQRKLTEEGKHKEVFDMQIADAEKRYNDLLVRYSSLEQTNLGLSRDNEVRDCLREAKFRSGKAAKMAFQEVSDQLIKNEQGQWVHRTGVSINDFVKSFLADDTNSFLLEAQQSSGMGSGAPTGTPPANQNKSLFAMSQEEVLKMAAEGKLGRK